MSDSFPSQSFATPHELPQPAPVARPEPASVEQTVARPSVDVAPTEDRRPDSDFRNQEELVDDNRANEADEALWEDEAIAQTPPTIQRKPMAGPRKGRRLVKRDESPRTPFTPEQRLLILDSWQRSGLPAGDFAPLVGVSKHTLYAWKKQFDQQGPAGLMDQPRGVRTGSRGPRASRGRL